MSRQGLLVGQDKQIETKRNDCIVRTGQGSGMWALSRFTFLVCFVSLFLLFLVPCQCVVITGSSDLPCKLPVWEVGEERRGEALKVRGEKVEDNA